MWAGWAQGDFRYRNVGFIKFSLKVPLGKVPLGKVRLGRSVFDEQQREFCPHVFARELQVEAPRPGGPTARMGIFVTELCGPLKKVNFAELCKKIRPSVCSLGPQADAPRPGGASARRGIFVTEMWGLLRKTNFEELSEKIFS